MGPLGNTSRSRSSLASRYLAFLFAKWSSRSVLLPMPLFACLFSLSLSCNLHEVCARTPFPPRPPFALGINSFVAGHESAPFALNDQASKIASRVGMWMCSVILYARTHSHPVEVEWTGSSAAGEADAQHCHPAVAANALRSLLTTTTTTITVTINHQPPPPPPSTLPVTLLLLD